MSSCSCLVCFIILAIIILIAVLPTFIFALAPELSSSIVIGGVVLLVTIAVCFITQAVMDDDDEPVIDSGQTTETVERENVFACPYCGHGNVQGTSNCHNCGGAL